MIGLKGMSWSHPRGYAPLIAASTQWRMQRGVEIVWDRHSLQDFESFPVEDLARGYDLMVIDHPHIGEAVAAGALRALDRPDCTALAAASVGPSYASYAWAGQQWALPVDAAAQVQAFRPDRLAAAPRNWADMIALARQGLVDCPLKAPHSLMAAYTLSAHLGAPCEIDGPYLFHREAGRHALEMLAELVDELDDGAFSRDPIDVLEAMARDDAKASLTPLCYGYVSYARPGFLARRLAFADILDAGAGGPRGSALGGAGVAVSAFSPQPEAAMDFAFWIASGPVQRTLYVEAGGQPAHGDAWDDAANGDFFAHTRATLERAWLRPRHNGYIAFQRAASARLNEGLRARERAGVIVDALNALYENNLRGRTP